MEIIKTVQEFQLLRKTLKGPVALVATLGGLHKGHEEHLIVARQLSDTLVGSVFLNPIQFNADEDLKKYPIDLKNDIKIFEKNQTDIVFAPCAKEIYPEGESTRVEPGQIGQILEGNHRPDHFTGVATIVSKLFAIIRPDLSTFGEKDAQQLSVIRKINKELGFGVEIVPIPTVRASDGLALSSRNKYLDREQRSVSTVLYRALSAAKQLWDNGERRPEKIKKKVREIIGQAPSVKLHYVSTASPDTFKELTELLDNDVLLSLAAQIGSARLLDNIKLS